MFFRHLALIPACTKTFSRALLFIIISGIAPITAGLADNRSIITLPKEAPFPESVTSTSDGTLFVSSISHGGVIRVAPDKSEGEVWIKPGSFGTRSTFGVLADERAGILWVCSNDASALGLPGPSSTEGAFVKGFDLKSGEGKVSYRLPGASPLCNDFALGKDGSLYVTDTNAPQILRLPPGGEQLEIWYTNDALKGGLDGIAFDADGNLYVNTFYTGELFRITVKDGRPQTLTKLETSRKLVNPDALRAAKEGFLMVEGVGTLDHITINGDHATVETIKSFAGPTSVTIVDGQAFVSEGQLAYLAAFKRHESLPTFQLRSAPLPP